MSTLTKKEREGLEDVFLSIHTDTQKLKKLTHLSIILIHKISVIPAKALRYKDRFASNASKLAQLFGKTGKKKKNLSK